MARTTRIPWEYTLATILFSAALLVVTQTLGSRVEVTHAAPHAYNSTWTVKRVLAVDILRTGMLGGSVLVDDLPIGVSEWEVKGSLDNSGFKETWSTPGGAALVAEFGPSSSSDPLKRENFNPAQWIHVIDWAGLNARFQINSIPADKLGQIVEENAGSIGQGNSLRCVGTAYCVRAAGQYGFTVVSSSSAFITKQPIQSFIPAYWTVTGYYCDDKAEAECQ